MTVPERESTYFIRGGQSLNCMTLQRGQMRGESFTPIYTIRTRANLTSITGEISNVLDQRMEHSVRNKLLLTLEQAREYADTTNKRINIDTERLSMRLPMDLALPIREGQTVASHVRDEAAKQLRTSFELHDAVVDVELRRDSNPCPVVRGPSTTLNFNHVNIGELKRWVGDADGSAYPALVGAESSILFVGMDINDFLHKLHGQFDNAMFVRKDAAPGTINWKPSTESGSVTQGYVAGSKDFYMTVKSRHINVIALDGYPDVAGIARYIQEMYGRSLRTTGITGFYLSCGSASGIFTQL